MFPIYFVKCLLKKNCLYIGREKEYSKDMSINELV